MFIRIISFLYSMRKWIGWALLFLIIINSVLSATLVTKETTDEKTISVGTILWNTIKYPLLILIILLVCAFIFIKFVLWIMKLVEKKDNTVQDVIKMKIGLARIQERLRYPTRLLKWRKNTKIYLFYKNNDGEFTKEPMGVYFGDFIDNEGLHWIAVASTPIHFLLWFIPKFETIMCFTKDQMEITKLEDITENKYKTEKVDVIPINIQFMDNEILIEANYLDKISPEFDVYFPIIKNTKGKVIDISTVSHQAIENLVLKKVQYDITNGYASNIRKAMDMNIVMKGKQKLQDTDGSVDQ